MIIKSINLTNFRSHTKYHLDCNQNTNMILGENGSGKTSVLEAIYILTRGKSFRATDPEIIKHGTEFYRIEIDYDNGEKSIAVFDGTNKTFQIADKKTRRLPKKNRYPVVLFLPTDLNLVSGSPSRHREYFDRLFSGFSDNYNESLLKYEKALKQRNELLKTKSLSSSPLFSWNLLLARYGTYLQNFRQQFVAEINIKLPEFYHSIAENNDEIELKYETEVKSFTEDKYLKQLESNLERDHLLGHTSFGVHRDDFVFYFNRREASTSASRGETRSVVLALKFTEASLILEKQKQKPLVLLDDVFSELDEARRKCLIKNFKDHQVIITSVENINEADL